MSPRDVISWQKDSEACRQAKLPIFRTEIIPEKRVITSPYAPADSSPYVQVTWNAIRDLVQNCYLAENQDIKTTKHLDQMSWELPLPDEDKLAYWKTAPLSPHTELYIPLAFLWALARNEVEWPATNWYFATITTIGLHNDGFIFQQENVLFDEMVNQYELPAWQKRYNAKHLWAPIRNRSGHLYICELRGSFATPSDANALKRAWQKAISLIKAPKRNSGNKPARYQTVDMGILKVRITKAGMKRFDKREGGPEMWFQSWIDKVNATKDTNRAELKLWDNDLDKKEGHQLLSKDPFGLYWTYVTNKDYEQYIGSLSDGCYESASKYAWALKTNAETRPLPEKTALGVSKLKTKDKKIKGRAEKEEARVQAKDVANASDKKVQAYEKSAKNITTVTFVPLTARKIKDAEGEREDEDGQNTIMGNQSASMIAAEVLKWKWHNPKTRFLKDVQDGRRNATPQEVAAWNDRRYNNNQMVNYLYIAEWLHLSAYSWGGLLSEEKTNQFTSSQISENLVIGTSETNSAMTRYEKAWQKIIKHEDEIAKTDGTYRGSLIITRHPKGSFKPAGMPLEENKNPKNVPNGLKQGPDGKWTYESLTKHKHTGKAEAYEDVVIDTIRNGEHIVKSVPMREEEIQIARDYRWICYQFDYHIRLQEYSAILQLDSPECKVRFYPFRRMLYHKVEHDLDTLLWKDMLAEAKGSINEKGEEIDENGNVKQKKHPAARKRKGQANDANNTQPSVVGTHPSVGFMNAAVVGGT